MIQNKEAVTTTAPNNYATKLAKKDENGNYFAENLRNNLMQKAEEVRAKEEQQHRAIFEVRPANEVVQYALTAPTPTPLYRTIWYEGEICCLFADSGNGKSLLAVQIAEEIAKTQKVLYFDFELSDEQFGSRYMQDGVTHTFPPNFYRVNICAKNYSSADDLIKEIKYTMQDTTATVAIVDNMTWIVADMTDGAAAGDVMKRFMLLKQEYGWSFLIIAHTPKIPEKTPITDNQLAGSKMFYNFLDSVFSIGKSVRGEEYRYIKQLKTRRAKNQYGAGNVIVTQLMKEGGMSFHKFMEYSSEADEIGAPQGKRTAAKDDGRREMFTAIFGEREEMRYTDIITAIKEHTKLGDETAKKIISHAKNDGILMQPSHGIYRLV